jgi:hypothetical protein
LTYVSKPASFLANLTKNLTSHLYNNLCAVSPKPRRKVCVFPQYGGKTHTNKPLFPALNAGFEVGVRLRLSGFAPHLCRRHN